MIRRNLDIVFLRWHTANQIVHEISVFLTGSTYQNGCVEEIGNSKKFVCNVCHSGFSNARNSKRHGKEAHASRTRYFECPEDGCVSNFLRRSYL